MKWIDFFYERFRNFFENYSLSRGFLFNSEQFVSTPSFYQNINFSPLERDYILEDSFFRNNNLNFLHSPNKKEIFFGLNNNLERKFSNDSFDFYRKQVLKNEGNFLKEVGEGLVKSQKLDPNKNLSYEFSNRGVRLKIK